MTVPLPDAWVSVSRPALRHNFQTVRTLAAAPDGPSPLVIAVVKANAFGHGAPETARVFGQAGASFFAVTTLAEALELRAAGIGSRILVFLPPLPDQWDACVEHDLEATVCDDIALRGLAQAARAQNKHARVHLKVDTGMGRLGVLPDAALPLARQVDADPDVVFAGIYTHFARALERDDAYVRRQFAAFEQVTTRLHNEGIACGLRHCANSAALVRFPQMRLDAVRPGTILYGQYPSEAVPRALQLQDTWTLQARIVAVRDLPRGASLGYGGEFVTQRASRIAVLPIGYADGFAVAPLSAQSGWRGLKSLLRGLGGSGMTVTVRGRRVPVVGRIAMQICTVDVSDVPGVQVGDVVSLPARRITASARLLRLYTD